MVKFNSKNSEIAFEFELVGQNHTDIIQNSQQGKLRYCYDPCIYNELKKEKNIRFEHILTYMYCSV